MTLFDKNRFRALASAFMVSAVLAGCGSSGGGGDGGGMTPDGMTPGGGAQQPTLMGTADADTPTLDSSFNGGDSDYNYDALGGNDAITISGSVDGNVLGGAGMDTFTLSGGGMVGGNLEGGAEADTFMLTGGSVGGDVLGGAGNDLFSVTGAVEADLAGDGGDDSFTLDAALTGSIAGGGDDDWIRLNPGASVSGMISGDGGADTFLFTGGTVSGNIDGGADNDEVTVTGSVTFGGTSAIDGGAGDMDRFVWGINLTTDSVDLSTTADTITLGGTPGVPDPTGFEIFVLGGGTIGSYTGSDNDDRVELLSGMVTGDVNAGGGNDRVTVTGGVSFTGASIDGGAGDMDRFVWGTGLTTIGVTVTGTATAPVFTLGGFTPSPTNFEIFVLDGGAIAGVYRGRNDIPDTFEYISGTLARFNGGLGAGDIFSAEGAAQGITATNDSLATPTDGVIIIRGVETITLGNGDDTFLVTTNSASDTATTIDGGAGVDRFVWGENLTATSVDLSTTADTITLGGTSGVPNPTGFEVFVLDGGTGTIGDYTGSANADRLELLEGSVTGAIDMGDGNDQFTVTDEVTFTGTIDGGAGALDRFVWGEGLTTTGVTVTSTAFTLAGTDHDSTTASDQVVPNPSNFEVFVLDGGEIGGYTGNNAVTDRIELLEGSVTGNITLGSQTAGWLRVTGGVSFGGSIAASVARFASFVWGEGLTTTGVTVTITSAASDFDLAGTDHYDVGTGTVPNPTGFEFFVLDGGTVGAGGYEGTNFSDYLGLISGTITGPISLGNNANIVSIFGDMVSDSDGDSENGVQPALVVSSFINDQGAAGNDRLTLGLSHTGFPGRVNTLRFSNAAPVADSGDVHLQGFEIIDIAGGIVDGRIEGSPDADQINIYAGMVGGNIDTGAGADSVFIDGDLVDGAAGALSATTLGGVINGGTGMDTFSLGGAESIFTGFFLLRAFGGDNGHVADIRFSNEAPVVGATLADGSTVVVRGDVHLQNFETITLDGGMVNGAINASGAPVGVTFDLIAGRAGPTGLSDGCDDCFAITGSGEDDVFIVSSDITGNDPTLDINGLVQGGGGRDEVRLVAGGVVNSIDFGDFTAGELNLRAIETITLDGGRVTGTIDASGETTAAITFNLVSGRADGNIIGSPQNDTFIVSGNVVNAELDVNGLIQGGGGDQDEVRLVAGGVVNSIDFGDFTAGELNLRAIETITIDGGRVIDTIVALAAPAGITFNLISGTIGALVGGSNFDDTFNLHAAVRIGILGGNAGTDVLRYAGAPASDSPTPNFFAARSGLTEDPNITDNTGSVVGFESQVDDPAITSLGAGAGGAPAGAGLRGLTVRGIEVLGLSPALNLYGAMSDALMQFGAQTAQGFALADLNLATGRATSLVSKNSPFTKGRIWAHKITHSGNGKGSIGLGLTGLTARADSDYDYEMSLTQHGFDAPLAATRLGAFNLRAVSHTMTGIIETNVAEANVSGYGAGVAMMWRGQNLVAHLTSLAGAYEVEAHTSPLNPRAVVSEVSEGSFSAINAVVSVGVADTRKLGHSLVLRTTADLVWQTLSLDDFSETGADGIIINFDKATRFTARVGAGLESEHWFSDVAFVHETSSGGTLSSGLRQDYRQDDGTAIEMKLGGKLADLATGLTLKAYAGLRTSLITSDSIDPSAHLALNWRF